MKRIILKHVDTGFTLVEILVVIAIIGVLATFSTIALNGSRIKARDAQRVAYINQIGTALELYYSKNNIYPTIITGGQPLSMNGIKYLDPVPVNPTPRTDGSCPNQDFAYSAYSGNTSYVISFCLGKATGAFSAGTTICDGTQKCKACGQYSLSYGGVTYNTVAIGTQCWLDKPLNYGTMKATGATAFSNNGVVEKYCPLAHGQPGSASLNESDCTTYGAIYPWTEAMNYSASECNGGKCQGICPTGWHIPTDAEWATLEQYLADSGQTCDPARAHGTYQCSTAGTKLKVNGSSGFVALIGGYRIGGSGDWYYRAGWYGVMWSSTAANSDFSWARVVLTSVATVARQYFDKLGGVSVRCIKD